MNEQPFDKEFAAKLRAAMYPPPGVNLWRVLLDSQPKPPKYTVRDRLKKKVKR